MSKSDQAKAAATYVAKAAQSEDVRREADHTRAVLRSAYSRLSRHGLKAGADAKLRAELSDAVESLHGALVAAQQPPPKRRGRAVLLIAAVAGGSVVVLKAIGERTRS